MKFIYRFCIFAVLFSAIPSSAQLVVQKDTIAGTPLTILMDAEVSKTLESMENTCATSKSSSRNTGRNEAYGTYSPPAPAVRRVANRELTNAEICQQNPRILGYKIQAAVVKSNDEANKIKADIRRQFPSLKVEVDASLRPNYKILVGSYFTKQSASSDLSRIRKAYPGAIAVQYRIFCVEAK